MSVLIKNGTVVTISGRYTADVFVEGEKIKAIGKGLDYKADETIDAKGKFILPGAIDPHTHISMPFMGTYAQDDFTSGTIAAACGGVTSLVDFELQMKGESLVTSWRGKRPWQRARLASIFRSTPPLWSLGPRSSLR
jgi:dihydropyrimidinase